MNRILPIGLSVSDNSISSKFNIGIETITIGQSAGLGSTGINNIFLGNRAGLNTTNVTETLLIGMNAGTNILTGVRNIIIGEDTSKITNKLDTISIGYNSIANNSIGIGLDIVSNGNSNISYGLNINSYGINSISYGNYIDITNSLFFIDTLDIDNNNIDGIIVKKISGNTDYDTNSILYKRYDINNNDKINIIDYNTDIILNFRINTNITFKFSLGFYKDNTDINIFTINNNILYYNNIEYNIQEALLYESDNILRIVNKYNDTSSISIYINSEYDTGFTKNIINKNIIDKNINNIRILYDLDDNNFINNYEIINSNITIFDNDIFNNKNTGISFNDFIISINNIDENKYNNVAYGKNISIKGTKNICMGNNLNAKGYNSILIGDNISYYDNNKFTKNIQNSIIIGNNNFKNNYNKNSIIIGNDNFNNIIDENDIIKYDIFLKKNPIIISSNVNTVDYVVNIADTILKYDDEITEKQVLLSGLNTYNNKTLPVGIGYSNLDDLNIINDDYKLYVKGGIYTDKIYSETYYGNGQNLINISFNGKTTSSLIEGDNLYFTKKRVEEILSTYNIGNIGNIGNTQNNNISINDVKNIINSCNYISIPVVLSIINSCNYITLANTGAFTNGVDIESGQNYKINGAQIGFANISGSVSAAQLPAFTGDATSSAGSSALTLATVNANIGTYGNTTNIPQITVNAKGLITGVATQAIDISNITDSRWKDSYTGIGEIYSPSFLRISDTNYNLLVGGDFLPASKLHIHRDGDSQIVDLRFTDNTTGATSTDGSVIRKNTSHQLEIYNLENADIIFGTNNTERMRISNTEGNVGIGTVTPGAKLHVNGKIIYSTDYITSTPTYDGGTMSEITPISGTNDYYVIITSSGNLTIPTTMYCDILIVGGGGAGGSGIGGGGGGGAVFYAQNVKIPNNTYPITIGAGGNNTVAFGITAIAGGSGGSYGNIGNNGGSGGGASSSTTGSIKEGGIVSNSIIAENSVISMWNNTFSIYGNNGGYSSVINATNRSSGGGGGAGMKGINGIISVSLRANGGDGFVCDITGEILYYGAGGGGAASTTGASGNGGLGGGGGGAGGSTASSGGVQGLNNGGNGSTSTGITGGAGGANTGSGGGGSTSSGSSGGSGVVIIRWKKIVDISSTLNNLEPIISKTKNYSVNKLTIYDNGRLGSGALNVPTSKLHIYEDYGTIPTANNGTIVLEHGDQGGTNSIVFKSKVNGSDYGYISYRDNITIDDKEITENARLIIGISNDVSDHIALMPSGNVGIGTETPAYKLDINGSVRVNNGSLYLAINRWHYSTDGKQRVYYANNSTTYFGSGSGNYIWRTATDSDEMTLNNGGFLGIGSILPSARLHVASGTYSSGTIGARYFSYATTLTSSLGASFTNICAIFESSIWCKSNIVSSSDVRIKKNIKDIDDEEALNLILAIEPKTYHYIDSVSNTSSNVYGFIAQQIKEIIPKAVVLQKNIIPNIYSIANCEGNNIYLSSNIDLSGIVLTSNTSIKLIDESGKEYTDKIIYSSNNHIVIEKEINTSNVFVYGTEVDDFHTIDKSYIYTLNVCATQILSRKIDILQRENEILKQENEIFKNELIQIKTHLGI